MSNKFLAVLVSLFWTVTASADGEGDSSVILITVSDIRSGDSVVEDWDQVSSGQPDEATLDVLKENGFSAVIDMRGVNEDRGMDEASAVANRGMTYISFPIVTASDITYENAQELDRLLSKIDGPVLVHCASGNRVGALYALREKLTGASSEASMALGKAAGLTRLEPIVAERLASK